MAEKELLRELWIGRLHEDLIGPGAPEEIIVDRPTDRYLTGILFPQGCNLPAEEDESLGIDEGDSSETATPDRGVPLASTFRPASMGLSFCLSGASPSMAVEVSLAVYRCRWVKPGHGEQEGGEQAGSGSGGNPLTPEDLTDEQREKKYERWCREGYEATIPGIAPSTEAPLEIDLQKYGLPTGAQLYVQASEIGGAVGVTAVLVNGNTEGEDRREDTERTFFQTRLRVQSEGGSQLAPRPKRIGGLQSDASEDEESGELIYRHVNEYAVGHTCSAAWSAGETPPAEEVRTEWIPRSIVSATSAEGDPVFEQMRRDEALQPLSADWLASAPADRLVAGLRLLPGSYSQWIENQKEDLADVPDSYRPTADRHVLQWEAARDRMETAVGLIESDEDVLRAFQLANRAMQRQREWATSGEGLTWRPFQLGFQLLVLSSLADEGDPDHDVMDLLWFPTGGGKTEAYLGVVAFITFLRRLRSRGSSSTGSDGGGVTVVMRYTLRLLTTQQFERAARLICACEVLRRKDPGLFGDTSISIGLWVGGSATANKVKDAHEDRQKSSLVIPLCPCCGEPVYCPKDQGRYATYCENTDNCALADQNEPLPIWTVDEDVYRELPSLLIGTIDKFAQIVRKKETARFFGLDTEHSSPELILQDELHLITGPLGTVAGLYEIAIDELCEAGGGRPKIIGSTATIRRAADQVLALFNRRVYQFPPPGLHAENSCFSVRDDSRPGRLYMGVTTAGRSPKFALQAVTASVLQSSQDARIEPAEQDGYWTLVTYFNSLRELGGAHVLMLDDVPKSVTEYAQRRREDARRLGEPVELSSNLSQSEIPRILKELDTARPSDGAIDAALATNMISVGMDVPRLALMIVNGQPKTIAEYIQATSRVGRDKVPGVVTCVFNVNKPRDRSHYETFTSWHGTLYRDVEATSVTPFAARAQDKALHAVLVTLVRHTVEGMKSSPSLSAAARQACEEIERAIAGRASAIDSVDGGSVPRNLVMLLDKWEQRGGLARYWNDRSLQRYPPLLMSAEAHAALQAVGRERQDIWPTMNSMREVEPTCVFRLAEFLKVDDQAADESAASADPESEEEDAE